MAKLKATGKGDFGMAGFLGAAAGVKEQLDLALRALHYGNLSIRLQSFIGAVRQLIRVCPHAREEPYTPPQL
jgi:hypothetical protein